MQKRFFVGLAGAVVVVVAAYQVSRPIPTTSQTIILPPASGPSLEPAAIVSSLAMEPPLSAEAVRMQVNGTGDDHLKNVADQLANERKAFARVRAEVQELNIRIASALQSGHGDFDTARLDALLAEEAEISKAIQSLSMDLSEGYRRHVFAQLGLGGQP